MMMMMMIDGDRFEKKIAHAPCVMSVYARPSHVCTKPVFHSPHRDRHTYYLVSITA